MAVDKPSPSPPSNDKIQFAVAEYNALRNEILKRSEFRYQIVSLTLLIAGTILTFGLQPSSPSYVLFAFPILACFLAGVWAHNVLLSRKIVAYITEHIEGKFEGLGWSTFSEKQIYSFLWLSGIISTSGIFLGTEIITLVLGLLKSTFTTIDIVLISIDSIAILITLPVLRSTTVKPK